MAKIVHYYRWTDPDPSFLQYIKEELELKDLGLAEEAAKLKDVKTENCFNVQLDADLTAEQTKKLEWLLTETFYTDSLRLGKSWFEEDRRVRRKPGSPLRDSGRNGRSSLVLAWRSLQPSHPMLSVSARPVVCLYRVWSALDVIASTLLETSS